MERSRADLARAIDALAATHRATVTESRTELALYQLDGLGARDVVARLAPAGFTLIRLADEGSDLRVDQLDDDSGGIELVATKPIAPDSVFPVLTATGFLAALKRAPAEPVLWVQGLDRCIEATTVCYLPWGTEHPFVVDQPPADPSRVVRVLGNVEPVQEIGRWLLRDADVDLSGRFLSGWRIHAATALARALAQEIEPDEKLLFRGPPPTRFRSSGADRLEVPVLNQLQRVAGWVYENPRELENRHGLVAAEVARTALRDGDITDLGSVMCGALEGARIAYGFGISQQSRDALKSLSELRKAVSDETTKLADATRTLAAAVTTSAVGNVGLVIARLTLGRDSKFVASAAGVIGLVLAIYVAVVIWSGWHFLTIQQDLRRDWRERLYRFLADNEYERMVSTPVEKAEMGYKKSAIASGAIAVLMLVAVLIIVF